MLSGSSTATDGVAPLHYYPTVLFRRIRHYVERRRKGYSDRGSLETAAEEIARASAEQRFRAGSHFPGVWVRDLCFAARGLVALGFREALRSTTTEILRAIDTTFYTDFHRQSAVATPAEGVDTFPALVLLLDETGVLAERSEAVSTLAALHREKFFDEDRHVVSGAGSSWWDSAGHSREAYNTAMLLTAMERLERHDVETTYAGLSRTIREAFHSQLWNGRYFDERRGASVLACDANVIPLYFGIVDERRAAKIAGSLRSLETEKGLKMRERPFTLAEVRPAFLLHRDYHYHIWPWNSFAYANGLVRYGYDERARREVARIERTLERFGNFIEAFTTDGDPYIKRGYAAAEDFTVAAALWSEYHRQSQRPKSGLNPGDDSRSTRNDE